MILFGLYTGARLSDVASLTWENVDLPARELRFMARKPVRQSLFPWTDRSRRTSRRCLPPTPPKTPLHPRAFAIVENSAGKPAISRTSSPICSRRRA